MRRQYAGFRPQASMMRRALDEATKNLKRADGGPFGACLTMGGRMIAVARNTVLRDQNPTCHAEMNAIRSAARRLGRYDLSGTVVYSTTEPCPMCFSALHWARVDAIVYGTRIQDVQKLGFNELSISNPLMKRIGKSPIRLIAPFLQKECRNLLNAWSDLPVSTTY